MTHNRCFVQFPHPGKEHTRDTGCRWHRSQHEHRRKFMQLRGKWIEGNGAERCGDLWAWGEWEPESDLIRTFDPGECDLPYPRHLWEPYYIARNSYRGLHNTDPFIFGEHILYSNCGQSSRSKRGLKHLARGSVIAFGSGKTVKGVREWMLDTVLVVGDSTEYDVRDARTALKDRVPAQFLDVVSGPLADHDEARSTPGACTPTSSCARSTVRYRLYRGATPGAPVDGMFSFFPATPAGGDMGFPRPLVDLPCEYFNSRNWQAPKGRGVDRGRDERCELWSRLVEQVRDAGLVLGTHAGLPSRRAVRLAAEHRP